MGYAWVGVAFWLFLTAAAVAGIVADYKKRKLQLEPLKAALASGQQLDPALIEKLLALSTPGHSLDPGLIDKLSAYEQGKSLNPLDFRVGGIITISSAIGVGLLALIGYAAGLSVSLGGIPLSLIVAGVALVALCVGVGLLLAASRIARDRLG